jgi:hypothetical protein
MLSRKGKPVERRGRKAKSPMKWNTSGQSGYRKRRFSFFGESALSQQSKKGGFEMKKSWLAVMVVLLMVLGMVSTAAAEGLGAPSWVMDVKQMENEEDEVEAVEVEENEEEDMDGPPDFVLEMLQGKFAAMDRSKLTIHGKPIVSETPPVIKEGRTLIPVKAVVNALGAEVEWDPESKMVTITKKDDTITITINLILGEQEYTVNGEVFTMDTEAQVIGNRTYVPLRFIAIALGEPVEYDAETKEVRIGRPESPGKSEEAKLRQKSETEEEEEEEIEEIEEQDEDENGEE